MQCAGGAGRIDRAAASAVLRYAGCPRSARAEHGAPVEHAKAEVSQLLGLVPGESRDGVRLLDQAPDGRHHSAHVGPDGHLRRRRRSKRGGCVIRPVRPRVVVAPSGPQPDEPVTTGTCRCQSALVAPERENVLGPKESTVASPCGGTSVRNTSRASTAARKAPGTEHCTTRSLRGAGSPTEPQQNPADARLRAPRSSGRRGRAQRPIKDGRPRSLELFAASGAEHPGRRASWPCQSPADGGQDPHSTAAARPASSSHSVVSPARSPPARAGAGPPPRAGAPPGAAALHRARSRRTCQPPSTREHFQARARGISVPTA